MLENVMSFRFQEAEMIAIDYQAPVYLKRQISFSSRHVLGANYCSYCKGNQYDKEGKKICKEENHRLNGLAMKGMGKS